MNIPFIKSLKLLNLISKLGLFRILLWKNQLECLLEDISGNIDFKLINESDAFNALQVRSISSVLIANKKIQINFLHAIDIRNVVRFFKKRVSQGGKYL